MLFSRAGDTAAFEEEGFFSYRRFFLNPGVVEKIPDSGKTQKDIKLFAAKYTDALYDISSGETDAAEKDLLDARRLWPEYFGTDFLIALLYEEKGDYRTAARYYKSYLNKLRAFRAGRYRISSPLIRSLATSRIEDYDGARELVRERLARYGIDLDRVRPAITPPFFLLPLVIIVPAATAYAVFHLVIFPRVKKIRKMRNPPEGFWICPRCEAENPDLALVCEECGFAKPEKHE